MSYVALNYGYWEFWESYDPQEGFYGNQKCIFDGENKLIYINQDVTSVSVKEDIYSGWKEWVQVRDNSKFDAAMRTVGGDLIDTGQYLGDVYFMINGWKIYIDHTCVIDGIVFNDDTTSPFIQESGTQLVTNKVSNLVQTLAPQALGIELPTAAENALAVWNYIARTLTFTAYTGPTTTAIRQEMDANSTQLASIKNTVENLPSESDIWNYNIRELTNNLTPEQFWNFLLSTPMAPGSAGEKLKQVLTTGNFIALK